MFELILFFLFRMLRDERGEVGDDDDPGPDDKDDKSDDEPGDDDDLTPEDNDDPNVFSVDDEPDDDLDDDDPDKKKTPAGKDDKDTELSKRVADLETSLKESTSNAKAKDDHINDLNRGISSIRRELKAAKAATADKDVEFSDAQLLSMLEEHKDDPAVQLQIMKQIGQQAAKGTKTDAVNEVEITGNKRQMDAILSKIYPNLNKEGSEMRTDVDSVKVRLGIADHPYGDFFATGAMLLQNFEGVIAAAKEQGKTEALKIKGEEGRKKGIKASALSSTGGKKSKQVELSSKVKSNIKEIGLNPRQASIYAKLIKSADRSMTMEE